MLFSRGHKRLVPSGPLWAERGPLLPSAAANAACGQWAFIKGNRGGGLAAVNQIERQKLPKIDRVASIRTTQHAHPHECVLLSSRSSNSASMGLALL